MNAESIVAVARTAMETTLLVSAPMLVSGLVIGLLVSIFQAVTSIQEMTLTFITKSLHWKKSLFLLFSL